MTTWEPELFPDTVHGAISDLPLSPEELDAEAERIATRPPLGFGTPRDSPSPRSKTALARRHTHHGKGNPLRPKHPQGAPA